MVRRSLFVFFVVMIPWGLFAMTSQEFFETLKRRIFEFDKKVKDLVIEIETILLRDGKKVGQSRSKVFRKANKIRIETVMEEGSLSTMVYDGEDGWILIPGKMPIKIENIPRDKIDPLRGIPQDAEVLGKEKISNRVCYVVRYKRSNMVYKLWIDSLRFIPLKMEIFPEKDEVFPPTVILFKDYRKVEGVWGLPYKMVVEHPPHTKTVSYVKGFEVNKGINEALFEVKAEEIKSIEEIFEEFGSFR